MNPADLRMRICPKCTKIGGITYEPISSTYRCRLCNTNNLRLEQAVHPRWTAPPKTGIQELEDIRQNYPKIPTDATRDDIVEEYCTIFEQGNPIARVLTARIYCPKIPQLDDNEFDPTTPNARFAAYLYAKKFMNRRRYQKDRAKRFKQEI